MAYKDDDSIEEGGQDSGAADDTSDKSLRAPGAISDKSQVLDRLRAEVDRNERMIQVKVALDYLLMLVEPEYRKAFEEAEKKATTPEELAELLVLAKKHIGQKNLIKLLGLDRGM